MSTRLKLLRQRAKALNVVGFDKLNETELANAIRERGGNVPSEATTAKVIDVKAVEVKSEPVPAVQRWERQHQPAPNVSLTVAPPPFTMPVPNWYVICGDIKNAALYMIAGAALYSFMIKAFVGE